MIHRFLVMLGAAVIVASGAAIAGEAIAAFSPTLERQLSSDDSDDKIAAIQAIAATADDQARQTLQALTDGTLLDHEGNAFVLNNRVRSELEGALAGLRLFDPHRAVRLSAASALQSTASPAMAKLLGQALQKETDDQVRQLLEPAYARAIVTDADPAQRLAAVDILARYPSAEARSLLQALLQNESDAKVRAAADIALKAINKQLSEGAWFGELFSGLSLGSVLLLVALGLAITYGVMGVINMAHGEMLMIGAYVTYGIQKIFQLHWPNHVDLYLLMAVPAAFLGAALVGLLLEQTVIRRLYGRPLETLLATWGLSLILIQAMRTFVGPQNVELTNPAWMSGSLHLMPGLLLPINRIVIIFFALFTLTLTWLLLHRTRLGLLVRAVTQNRAMAACTGVATAKVDALTFALGSGIAGLGGVALSQIGNVGPDMGQGYIVDSFMVVVLGGVGQLAGTVSAATGLGVVNKLLEGWSGAVIAKIVVLVGIILFIQWRPQGIFAVKGRSAQS